MVDAGVWPGDEHGPRLQKGSGPNADKNNDNCNTAELQNCPLYLMVQLVAVGPPRP